MIHASKECHREARVRITAIRGIQARLRENGGRNSVSDRACANWERAHLRAAVRTVRVSAQDASDDRKDSSTGCSRSQPGKRAVDRHPEPCRLGRRLGKRRSRESGGAGEEV